MQKMHIEFYLELKIFQMMHSWFVEWNKAGSVMTARDAVEIWSSTAYIIFQSASVISS